tara:strand:- start:407 stop:772 length:366 start_codon:yes stop_codon:yes gene_type:complete
MKKSKVWLFVFLFMANFSAIFFFGIPLNFEDVFVIHSFLLSLFFLTDLIQTKLSKKNRGIPHLLLGINFLRIVFCVLFLNVMTTNFQNINNNYVYNFFFVYFFILFSGVYLKSKNKREINQ